MAGSAFEEGCSPRGRRSMVSSELVVGATWNEGLLQRRGVSPRIVMKIRVDAAKRKELGSVRVNIGEFACREFRAYGTPNKPPEPTTMAVTSRAPSSTGRASHGRGSS